MPLVTFRKRDRGLMSKYSKLMQPLKLTQAAKAKRMMRGMWCTQAFKTIIALDCLISTWWTSPLAVTRFVLRDRWTIEPIQARKSMWQTIKEASWLLTSVHSVSTNYATRTRLFNYLAAIPSIIHVLRNGLLSLTHVGSVIKSENTPIQTNSSFIFTITFLNLLI